MSKAEFLAQLRNGLNGLPQDEIEERLAFYSEMIDDRMEEGLSELEAVSEIGSVDELEAQIIAETSFAKIAKEKIKPKRRLSTAEILLLVLGSPIWLSLGIAAVAVLFSLYVVLWSVIGSLWAVFASIAGSFIGCITAGVIFVCKSKVMIGLAMISAGVVCAGLSVFCFFGCKALTRSILLLTESIAVKVKSRFMKKGDA